MVVGVFYLRGLSDVTEVVALSRARTCSRSESKLCMTGLRDKPRPPAFGPELCLLLQFLVTGSLPEARCPAEAFLRASHMPFLLCLPPGQLWYQYSPLWRMTSLTKSRTLLAPCCAGSRTGCRESRVSPSRYSMAVASFSTALVFYPTAGPSPLWISQDPGWEWVGCRERGLG